MSTIAAILTAITEILKQWRSFAVSAWKKDGERVAAQLRDAKTDEEASKALKDLDDHLRGP